MAYRCSSSTTFIRCIFIFWSLLSSPIHSFSPGTQPPESVVHLQLDALQRDDMFSVYKHASPKIKAVTGPWQRFAQMIHTPPYNILVGHSRAEVLMISHQKDSPIWQCLVRVWPSQSSSSSRMRRPYDARPRSKPGSIDYMWTLSKCTDGCWRVDGVMPN